MWSDPTQQSHSGGTVELCFCPPQGWARQWVQHTSIWLLITTPRKHFVTTVAEKVCWCSHNNHILSHLCYSTMLYKNCTKPRTQLCNWTPAKWFLKALLRAAYFSLSAYNAVYVYLLKLFNPSFKSHRVKVKTREHVSHLHLVTTPSSLMMLGWSNWPMMLASLRKSRLCFSEYPAFRLLMAT